MADQWGNIFVGLHLYRKDMEKNKRMKGQSSHSEWKSEAEMALRQQYD
jgi:hypothetical protein